MSDAPPLPGPDGTPLPGLTVFRLAAEPRPADLSAEDRNRLNAGRVPVPFFALSSADRASAVPHLSVWCAELTTIPQAWAILGGAGPRYVLTLPVDGIRGLSPLDVCWFRAVRADGTPEDQAGAAGHSGVVGLDAGSKFERKQRRNDLADLAARAGVRLLTEAELAGG